MKRSILALLALACASLAHAQPWPTKPIRCIVIFAPGGTTDVLARLIGPKMSDALGGEMIAKARPDGYTIGSGAISSHAINVTLYPKLPYDPYKDVGAIPAYLANDASAYHTPDTFLIDGGYCNF